MTEEIRPVDVYLNDFKNKVTRAQHKSHLKLFFELLGIENPNNYFQMNRDYEADVKKLWNSMEDHATGTRKMRFGVVLSFLEDNDVVIKKRTLNNLMTRTKTVPKAVHDIVPTKKEMKILRDGVYLLHIAVDLYFASLRIVIIFWVFSIQNPAQNPYRFYRNCDTYIDTRMRIIRNY